MHTCIIYKCTLSPLAIEQVNTNIVQGILISWKVLLPMVSQSDHVYNNVQSEKVTYVYQQLAQDVCVSAASPRRMCISS